MALKDYPKLKAAFDELSAEKAALAAKSEPLRALRDAILAKIQPLVDEERAVAAQIKAIERPRMAEIDSELSAIARATGGRSLHSAA